MPESLMQMWSLIEVERPLLTAHDMVQLCDEQRAALESLGFLVPAATASHIVCPECHDDHVAEVSRVRQHGKTQFFVTCPEAGLCEVDGDLLRQWSIDCDAVARVLKRVLAPAGRNALLMPGRVWRLGTTPWQQATRDLVFARGLGWPDAADATRAIAKATCPIVLVPDQIPDDNCWGRGVPPIVALSRVSQLCDRRLEITVPELFSAVSDQDERPQTAATQIFDDMKLKLIVRQQVKAESKSQLTDDLVVAAYKEHGSSRKAAIALTKKGYSIHHSTVARIVKKSGEITREDSSESIVRSVASQRRNNSKKIQNRPEATDWE